VQFSNVVLVPATVSGLRNTHHPGIRMRQSNSNCGRRYPHRPRPLRVRHAKHRHPYPPRRLMRQVPPPHPKRSMIPSWVSRPGFSLQYSPREDNNNGNSVRPLGPSDTQPFAAGRRGPSAPHHDGHRTRRRLRVGRELEDNDEKATGTGTAAVSRHLIPHILVWFFSFSSQSSIL
jgi:hypothetical protein